MAPGGHAGHSHAVYDRRVLYGYNGVVGGLFERDRHRRPRLPGGGGHLRGSRGPAVAVCLSRGAAWHRVLCCTRWREGRYRTPRQGADAYAGGHAYSAYDIRSDTGRRRSRYPILPGAGFQQDEPNSC